MIINHLLTGMIFQVKSISWFLEGKGPREWLPEPSKKEQKRVFSGFPDFFLVEFPDSSLVICGIPSGKLT